MTSTLLHTGDYPKTADLMSAVEKQFQNGAGMVHVAEDSKIVGLMLSPEVANRVLAEKAAQRLVSDPASIEDVLKRLQESPEEWK